MRFEFAQVAPPAKAPVHPIAETLGLCDGLKAERSGGQYRCAACWEMQPVNAWQVWVPDGVQRHDPAWSVEESCRLALTTGAFWMVSALRAQKAWRRCHGR